MPQLSCESCAQRKVRCDKEYPCATCKKMGITCVPVQRMRLPRGRHVHTLKAENRELRDKLEKLNETLENKITEQGAPPPMASGSNPPLHSTPRLERQYDVSPMPGLLHPSANMNMSSTPSVSNTSDSNTSFGNLQSKDFWNEDMQSKSSSLGDFTDHPLPPLSISDNQSVGSSERRQSPSQGSSSAGLTGSSSFILGLGSGPLRDPGAYLEATMAARPTPEITAKLWDVYSTRVDPIIRIFHSPTLCGFILHRKQYLKYDENDPTLNLIRSSVFFIGVATLQDSQCRSLFGVEKQALMDTYRSACELALEQVELVITEDMTVLQAFMLYLLAIRTYDRSRKTWTLFSIAVRLATAIGINEDDFRSYEPFFDQQMRRRLWYAMCSMDAHLSFDRASKPIIVPNSKHPRLPHNINEADFGPLSEDLPERQGITDMSLCLMLYRTQATGKGLNFVAMTSKSLPDGRPDPEVMAKRKAIWQEYESFMIKLLSEVDPNSSPANWCLYHNGFAAFGSLQLTSRRPTQAGARQRQAMDSEPTNVLRMAVVVIEHDLLKRWDIRGEPFHWHGNTLWNPLSVAISECYTCNDVVLLQQVWPIIETHFNCMATILAEYRKGILWQPLERLIAKTRVRVRNAINQQAAMNGGMLAPVIYYPLQPCFPEATLTEDMIMPTASYVAHNYPTLSVSVEGLLPLHIATPYNLTPAPWSPIETQPMPFGGSPFAEGKGSMTLNAYSLDASRMDPGFETWDNFLTQINFDMNVQGP